MIYVRSKSSIQIFPRASLALFLVYHFYYYSFPSGFHCLALFVYFLLLVWLMMLSVRKFEISAFSSGEVSFDQPRLVYILVQNLYPSVCNLYHYYQSFVCSSSVADMGRFTCCR